MASLTPGILSKLLLNVDTRVTGHHRSALLQVIGILPSLSGDPWESAGYFLRVSDSLHSAYVSVLGEDSELVLTGKIQLGRFIHVARLDSGNPVPVLRGFKLVPGRPPAVVGKPVDLISEDSLSLADSSSSTTPRKRMDGERRTPKAKVGESKGRRLSLDDGKVDRSSEVRRLSLSSARKGWDRSPETRKPGRSMTRDATFTEVITNKKATPATYIGSKKSGPVISPLQNKDAGDSEKVTGPPVKKAPRPASDGRVPSQKARVTADCKTSSGSSIVWDCLPTAMMDLGKGVVRYKNATLSTAVHALGESFAIDCVIQCMSVFGEVCKLGERDSSAILVEQFLDVYQNTQKAAAEIDGLLRRSQAKANPNCGSDPLAVPDPRGNCLHKNATSWVQAAIDSDLSRLALFARDGNVDRCHYVVLESVRQAAETKGCSPEAKQNLKKCTPDSKTKAPAALHSSKRMTSTNRTGIARRVGWSEGDGLKEAAGLAGKLLSFARGWFLDYLEKLFSNGFGSRKGEGSHGVATFLGQLKRVDRWLNDLGSNGRSSTDERAEGLRKKLYEFVLDRVDSVSLTRR